MSNAINAGSSPIPLRLLLLADFPEEQWASMDFCGEMLLRHLQSDHPDAVSAEAWCPPFRRAVQRLPVVGRKNAAFNADRLLNRFWMYPRALRRHPQKYDIYHIVDHTYAQLALSLPSQRTGVFCHDLDAFRCLIDPAADPRPRWFRAMARRQLAGLQRAARVFHTTDEVRRQILHHGLIEASRLIKAPLGVAVEYTPESPADIIISPQAQINFPYVLHVGSCIPRKRIDILLNVFAGLRQHTPDLRLVKVGGTFSAAQNQQIQELALAPAIIHLHNLPRTDVAHLYRHARLVLITSDNEGFGIPLIEGLACGAICVVSDIPALREVGGAAATYCPVEDMTVWVESARRILDNPDVAPTHSIRFARAALYSWRTHADVILNAYQSLLRTGS